LAVPFTLEWDEMLLLTHGIVEEAKFLDHSDLDYIDRYIKSQDSDDRQAPQYIIRIIQLNHPETPLKPAIVKYLGSLLHDKNNTVLGESLCTIKEISKFTDVGELVLDLISSLADETLDCGIV